MLSSIVPEPIFVKIGANDGILGDPCSDIILASSNWKGILIEPVPYLCDRLRANFSNRDKYFVEQVAISEEAGYRIFYCVDENAKEKLRNLTSYYDQLGSFDRNHIIKHLKGALEPFIVEINVEVCPISVVMRRNGIDNVHLLHIDTEGYDYQILRTWDFTTIVPIVIYIEHRHLSRENKSEMYLLLSKNGYTVQDNGSDYFAVNRESLRIHSRLNDVSLRGRFISWTRIVNRRRKI